MTDTLVVFLGDAIAGTLTRLARGKLRFDYEHDYARRPDATPLSASMPLQVASHPDHVIAPWLWGLLPENEAVLARWARQFQASASSAFSLLGTPIGRDCAGAVRFAPPADAEALLSRGGRVTWLTSGDVAGRLRELKRDATAWLGQTSTGQFSLAGAQAKTALLRRGSRWGVPSGDIATTHILKPAVAGLDDHDLNEHLCLAAARRVGLLAARTHIERFAGESALVVERYDRRGAGRRVLRVHQEDLCQAMGVSPSRKYQHEGGPGPRDAAALFRRVMSPSVADEAVRRFADALIWNWLIAGTDAHAKNYSLLLAESDVRLAPLYDVASALPYGLHQRKLRFAMKIGPDHQVDPRRDPWEKAASDLGLDHAEVRARVRDIALRAPDAFADVARAPDVAALRRDLPRRLVELVAARCRRLLPLVERGGSAS